MLDITEKDVYGQSQDGRMSAKQIVEKYASPVGNYNYKPTKTNNMTDLTNFLKFSRGLSLVVLACFLCIIAAKVVTTFAIFTWNLW